MAKSVEFHGNKLEKGVFVAPFNQLKNLKNNSWIDGRMVDYIWMAFIIDYYGRTNGLLRLRDIFHDLCKFIDHDTKEYYGVECPDEFIILDLNFIQLSKILKFDKAKQEKIFKIVLKHIDKVALSPLTLIFTYAKYSCFSKNFVCDRPYEDRLNKLESIVKRTLDHQFPLATDVRFAVVLFQIYRGKIGISKDDSNTIKNLNLYPKINHDDERMHSIRPYIRALEIGMPYKPDLKYTQYFWETIGKLGECKMAVLKYEKENSDSKEYIQITKDKLSFYTQLYVNVKPLDDKMMVLLGITTFAYKRLLEVVEHDLYNTISGRSNVRGIIECYFMIEYLLKIEKEIPDVWVKFQLYGWGGLKKVCEHYIDHPEEANNHHVDCEYLKLLVEEKIHKEFIDMDTRPFNDISINKKADAIGEGLTYKLVYDYDSQFEHALWGAVRESSMLACGSPLHKYHCVPDLENNQNLKSVWSDCKLYMDKIIDILESFYGNK